jgi:hypothetical protein
MDRRLDAPGLTALDSALSHAALETRLVSVLEFAVRHVTRLPEYSELWEEELDPFVNLADKVVVETALLAMIAGRTGRPRVVALADDLANALAPYARSIRTRTYLLRFPHTACSLGMAHIALTCAGSADSAFDSLVRVCFSSGHAEALERLPYRCMEMRWLRALYEGHQANFDDLLPGSLLSTAAHPVHMSSAEAYALTHAFMYLTDFGQQPLPIAVDADRCSEMVDANIAWHVVGENFDLLGECLLAASFLGRPWTPYARLGWDVLSRAWHKLGFLPCPSFEPEEFAALEPEQARAYAFRHTYHTMHVAGMLCAALLQHPLEGTNAIGLLQERPDQLGDLARRCLRAVQRSEIYWSGRREATAKFDDDPEFANADPLSSVVGRIAASIEGSDFLWRQSLGGSRLTERELASVLLDGFLIHSAREYELAALAAGMVDFVQLRLPVTPTVVEAAEFLLRQQFSNGAIGAHLLDERNAANDSVGRLSIILESALKQVAARSDCLLREVPRRREQ